MEATIHMKSNDEFKIVVTKHVIDYSSRIFYNINISVGKNNFIIFADEDEYKFISSHIHNYEFVDYTGNQK